MNANVLQVKFTNESDKKVSASLFQLFSDNAGIKSEPSYANMNISTYFQTLRNWLLKNKFDTELIRLQFSVDANDQTQNLFYFRHFSYQSGNPFGAMMTQPMFVVGELFSPIQFQQGIIDIPVDAEFDGYSTDLIFNVYPKESFVITLFEKISEEQQKRIKERMKGFGGFEMSEQKPEQVDRGLTPFKGFPIVVENTSDEEMVIDLFSADHYRKLVEYDKNGLVYVLFQGRESFGEKYSIGNDEKEYGYICDVAHIKPKDNEESRRESSTKRYYDCVRIVNPNQHELNDITVNGRTIKTKGYVNENQFCKIAVDVRLEGKNNYDSFIVTVPPKTNMMFSFGIHDDIKEMKPPRLKSGYSNEPITKQSEKK